MDKDPQTVMDILIEVLDKQQRAWFEFQAALDRRNKPQLCLPPYIN